MSMSTVNCTLYRIAGVLLVSACGFTIILTGRYFRCRYQKRIPLSSLSPILIGMLVSFLVILFTAIPLVLIQCFSCQPLNIYAEICKINAFVCFAIGIFNMYLLALLSICRYMSINYQHSRLNHFFKHYRGLNVFFCVCISLCLSVPPFLNLGNTYIDEGIGFHCSLNWNSSAFQSRLFLYSLLICNYFLILIILIYTNLQIYFILRHLLKRNDSASESLFAMILRSPIVNTNISSNYPSKIELNYRKRFSDRQLKRQLNRLQRLKIDQRYARITAIMVIQFIFAWSPYAILALLIIHGQIEFVRQYPIFAIGAELLANLSIILNPMILVYTNKMRQY